MSGLGEMSCYYCRKKISAAATICPYCQRGTKKSQALHARTIVPVLVCIFLGWGIFGFLPGIFYGGIVGVVLGVVWTLLDQTPTEPPPAG